MNWRKFFASKDAGFWLFISLLFFGSMIWAKSRDPFERIWFTVTTSNYGKVKGVAVLPKPVRPVPVVFYVYGAGGSLINSGNELRQLAELGMAAMAIEYNQTNQAAFEEQFSAARQWATSNLKLQISNSECWLGFSLGAERTTRFLLNYPEMRPNLYVRLAGGAVSDEFKFQSSMSKVAGHSTFNPPPSTKLLIVHGENDEIFPVEEAKEAAAFFKTNGFATELKILLGKSHGFGPDRGVVYRTVGEYIKAQLTPEQPLPEFPVTKNYSFVLCIAPAFLWVGFWIYLRKKGGAGDSPVLAGDPSASFQNIEHPTSNNEHRKLKKWEIGLRIAAVILATAAIAQTGIHLITPRLPVSDATIRIARNWLLAPKWNEDFETLASKSFWSGQRLKTLLTHVELANYCVYELINWKVDKNIYNEFVLSPVIDATTELNWRRPFWEFFYPRIRREDTPAAAAEIVVRTLRERVTISREASFSADRMSAARSGIETIWRNQITDEKGFQRIYVAALRSVGVGARLNSQGDAEFWTGEEWRDAPRPFLGIENFNWR